MDTNGRLQTLSDDGKSVYPYCTITMPTQEEAPLPLASGRLDSWKEIADYLCKGVTTVRRWEKDEGLPVRRQGHLKRGSVVAYKQDLVDWRNARTTALPEEPKPAPPNGRSGAGGWIRGDCDCQPTPDWQKRRLPMSATVVTC